MHTEPTILQSLRSRGERLTPIRRTIVELFSTHHMPLAPQEMLALLKKHKHRVNKTTVYRQLEALVELKVIHPIYFADRITRYELAEVHGHHHHLVCVQCGRVEDVSFPSDLETQEKAISRKYRFKVLQHSLEFFGLCKRCF